MDFGVLESEWGFVNRVRDAVERHSSDGFGKSGLGVCGVVGDIVDDMGVLMENPGSADFASKWKRLGMELADVLGGRLGSVPGIERMWLIRLRHLTGGVDE